MSLNHIPGLLTTLFISLIFSINGNGQKLALTTTSDSALHYYYQGWEQVLDYGHFTNSEQAYRRMYAHDPNLWVGACLLARITQNVDERNDLIQKVEQNAHLITGDERRLLDLFLNLAKLYQLRETGQGEKLASHLEYTFSSGERTLALLAIKYPDDQYYKSEYIEVLHRNYGPKTALDSLDWHFKQPPPFTQGYKSQLLSELKEFEQARKEAETLRKVMEGKSAPYVSMVFAKLYKEMGDTDKALAQLEQALSIDPQHILAKRMKEELLAR